MEMLKETVTIVLLVRMEEEPMDEAWNKFIMSGKINDYLKFCKEREAREEKVDGNKSRSDRDGVECHANWRI